MYKFPRPNELWASFGEYPYAACLTAERLSYSRLKISWFANLIEDLMVELHLGLKFYRNLSKQDRYFQPSNDLISVGLSWDASDIFVNESQPSQARCTARSWPRGIFRISFYCSHIFLKAEFPLQVPHCINSPRVFDATHHLDVLCDQLKQHFLFLTLNRMLMDM